MHAWTDGYEISEVNKSKTKKKNRKNRLSTTHTQEEWSLGNQEETRCSHEDFWRHHEQIAQWRQNVCVRKRCRLFT